MTPSQFAAKLAEIQARVTPLGIRTGDGKIMMCPDVAMRLINDLLSMLTAARGEALEDAAQMTDARLLHGVSERIRALKTKPKEQS